MGGRRLSSRQVIFRLSLGAIVGGMISLLCVFCCLSRQYKAEAKLLFPLPAGGERLGAFNPFIGDSTVPLSSDLPLSSYLAVLGSTKAAQRAAAVCDVKNLYELPSEQAAATLVRQLARTKLNQDRTISVAITVPGTPAVQRPLDFLRRGEAWQRDDPYRQLAPRLIEQLIAAMGDLADESQLDRLKAELLKTREQLRDSQLQLSSLIDQQTRLLTASGGVAPGDIARLGAELRQSIQIERENTRGEVAEYQKRLAAVRAGIEEQLAALDQLPAEAPLLQEQRKAVRELLDAYERATKMYGPDSPQVLRAAADLQRATAALDRQAAAVRYGLAPELLALQASLAGSQARLKQQDQALHDVDRTLEGLPSEVGREDLLGAEIAAQREMVANLRSALAAAEAAYERAGLRWFVLDPPTKPKEKEGPSGLKGLLVGLIAGSLLVFLPLARPTIEWFLGEDVSGAPNDDTALR